MLIAFLVLIMEERMEQQILDCKNPYHPYDNKDDRELMDLIREILEGQKNPESNLLQQD